VLARAGFPVSNCSVIASQYCTVIIIAQTLRPRRPPFAQLQSVFQRDSGVIQTRKWGRFVPNHQATREDTPWSPLPTSHAHQLAGPNSDPRSHHRIPRLVDPKLPQLQNGGSKRRASGVSARPIQIRDSSPLVWKPPSRLLLCQNRGGKRRLSGIEAVEMPNEWAPAQVSRYYDLFTSTAVILSSAPFTHALASTHLFVFSIDACGH